MNVDMESAEKRRVLFVDDEPEILASLEDGLEEFKSRWDMKFAKNGEEALSILDRDHTHLMVTDLQMPGMDGAQLLAEARRRHPETARVIMSGCYDKETALRLVCATHQYLPKPCRIEVIQQTIERIFRLRDLLMSDTLQRLVARIKSLPSLPTVYTQLMAELEKDDPELDSIGQIISHDPGMSAKILQLVNSAYLGLPREVSHPSEATMFLGVDLIRGLVLMAHVFTQFDKVKMDAFSIEKMMEHSWLTGIIARGIAEKENLDARQRDHVFIGGLLHDIGKLILVANLPELYLGVCQATVKQNISFSEAEADTLGCNHAEVGAYLLGLWGLPDPVVEAVAYHNKPTDCEAGGGSISTIIYAASELEKIRYSTVGIRALPVAAMEELKRSKVDDKLEGWWEICQDLTKQAD